MLKSIRRSEVVFWANENQELKPALFDYTQHEILNFTNEHQWFSAKYWDFHKELRGGFTPTNQIIDVFLPLTQNALFACINEPKDYIYGCYEPQEGERLYYLHLGYIIAKDMSNININPRYSEHHPNTPKQLYQNLQSLSETLYKLSFNHKEIIQIK